MNFGTLEFQVELFSLFCSYASISIVIKYIGIFLCIGSASAILRSGCGIAVQLLLVAIFFACRELYTL